MTKAPADIIECADLIHLENRTMLLETEIQRGYENPAALGYAQIELASLREDYQIRRQWYLEKDPASLSRYEAHKQTFADMQREGTLQAKENRLRHIISIKMNLTVSAGTPKIDMSLDIEPTFNR
ncbi:hypothetical protein FHR76_001638 [Rhizobium sp. RAS22]|nr:hypothetical protein [Rhizobium sp. RAS22]